MWVGLSLLYYLNIFKHQLIRHVRNNRITQRVCVIVCSRGDGVFQELAARLFTSLRPSFRVCLSMLSTEPCQLHAVGHGKRAAQPARHDQGWQLVQQKWKHAQSSSALTTAASICGGRSGTQLSTNHRALTNQFDFPQLCAVMVVDFMQIESMNLMFS